METDEETASLPAPAFAQGVSAQVPVRSAPAPDELRQSPRRAASFPSRKLKRERRLGAPAVAALVNQSCRPTLAGIIGARLAWTVAMISSVSMPCR
jgi:hypothetical protein